MVFRQVWQGRNITKGDAPFPASVPGSIQFDYGMARQFQDFQYADNYRQYLPLENDHWEYSALLQYEKCAGESVWFVSGGIDYQYEILLNGELLYAYEGMYQPVELDLTDRLRGTGDLLTVHIFPHPKSRQGAPDTRDEAAESCKPPVCYGWDWNPRLLISGMWEDAYLETRNAFTIRNPEVLTRLEENLTDATVSYSYECEVPCELFLYDADGAEVYRGTEKTISVKNPRLWWCNGQGEASLYRWEIKNERESRSGFVGFRRIRLVRNAGADDPKSFPKSRYNAPLTIELNGRRIMAKGSNWVNPDVFQGKTDRSGYLELLTLVKDANMNILRMWGGSGLAKDSFYEICDRFGILVWQEFMLACNHYRATPHYMEVLKSEAQAAVLRVRRHPCLALWCGGNELFNSWSGMDDQSHVLRFLNKICYELDYDTPFLPTSPVIGSAHGGYKFWDKAQGGEVIGAIQNSSMTAYCEFGVPSISPLESLKKIIPPTELFPPKPTASWVAHHGFDAWTGGTWLCLETLETYFGKPESIEDLIAQANFLQCAGYQGAFEEMRRQWPHCSMCINWCFDEPWITAANNSLIAYPDIPKPAYYAVRDALRPVLFTAKIKKIQWKAGETVEAELWFHNDTPEKQQGSVHVTMAVGERKQDLGAWSAVADANSNLRGPTFRAQLPVVEDTDCLELILNSEEGYSNRYRLQYVLPKAQNCLKILNL